jgi:hypothetical protein
MAPLISLLKSTSTFRDLPFTNTMADQSLFP